MKGRLNLFKDIKIFSENEPIEYNYELNDENIKCKIQDLNNKNYSNLKIIYDENIYQIELNQNVKKETIKAGEILIYLEENNEKISFTVSMNYKYFIKTVYKFMNKFIDKETLIKEIDIFKMSKVGKKYEKDLNNLLNEIHNNDKPIEELLLSGKTDDERIIDLLLNNKLYISLVNQMNEKDLMLLITYYIFAPMHPKVDQKTFNDLVICAINYDHSLENVWRLGMSYDCQDYNYDLLDEFFVNSKDSWYLAEYISGIRQVDQEKITNMIIQTKDREFIKKLLKDNFIQSHLEEKYQDNLKKFLEDK